MDNKKLLKWMFENKPTFRIGDKVWLIQDGEPQTDIITGVNVVERRNKTNQQSYLQYEYVLNKNGTEWSRLFESEESLRCYIDYMLDKSHESETE